MQLAPSSSDAPNKRAQDESEREEKISRALSRVEEGLSYRQAAKEIGISFGTVYGRFRGRKSRVKAQEARMKLSFLEETIIEKMLLTTVYTGEPYTQPHFVQAANLFLQAQGDTDPEKVTRQWYRHFRRRHPSMDARDYAILHKPPSPHHSFEAVESWFKKFEEVFWANKVSPSNTYCVDELGFCRGPAFTPSSPTTQNRNLNPFKSAAATTNRMESPGNLAHIPPPPADTCTIVETICADGSLLPPYSIMCDKMHQQASSIICSTTLPSSDPFAYDSWGLASTKSGWPNAQTILDWLENHFDKLTRAKAAGEYRLVVLDTHAVHFTTSLLQFAVNNKIILLFTPALAIPNLHPFTNALLSALESDIYCKPSGDDDAQGRPSVAKFLSLVNDSRRAFFTKDMILRLWRESGLVPFDSSAIQSDVQSVKTEPSSLATEQDTTLSVTFLPVLDLDVDTFPASPAATPRIESSASSSVGNSNSSSSSKTNKQKNNAIPNTSKNSNISHHKPSITTSIKKPSSSSPPNTNISSISSLLNSQHDDEDSYNPPKELIFSKTPPHLPSSNDFVGSLKLAGESLKRNRQLNDAQISYNSYMHGVLKRLHSSMSDISPCDDENKHDDKRKRMQTVSECLRELESAMALPPREIEQLKAAASVNNIVEKALLQAQAVAIKDAQIHAASRRSSDLDRRRLHQEPRPAEKPLATDTLGRGSADLPSAGVHPSTRQKYQQTVPPATGTLRLPAQSPSHPQQSPPGSLFLQNILNRTDDQAATAAAPSIGGGPLGGHSNGSPSSGSPSSSASLPDAEQPSFGPYASRPYYSYPSAAGPHPPPPPVAQTPISRSSSMSGDMLPPLPSLGAGASSMKPTSGGFIYSRSTLAPSMSSLGPTLLVSSPPQSCHVSPEAYSPALGKSSSEASSRPSVPYNNIPLPPLPVLGVRNHSVGYDIQAQQQQHSSRHPAQHQQQQPAQQPCVAANIATPVFSNLESPLPGARYSYSDYRGADNKRTNEGLYPSSGPQALGPHNAHHQNY